MQTFANFGLSQFLQTSLEREGFITPTEVQSQAISVVLSGKDLMASAQTGSGKTAAYALPVIDMLKKSSRKGPRALVVVPTRELALQVKEQFQRFGRQLRVAAIYGGTGYLGQYRVFERGVDVIVSTPGRLLDLVEQGATSLMSIQILVLDEADRLMDMGFMPQIRQLVEKLPERRQTLMFSATIDTRIEELSAEYLTAPCIIRSTSEQIDPASIEQAVHYLQESDKDKFVVDLLSNIEPTRSVLIFTKTREKASDLAEHLRACNIDAHEIHGEINQRRREKIMARYRNNEFTVLVATDIAARGLDVPHIAHVINYDLPTSAEDYVHRIGRTGRAGREGKAHSLVSREQLYLLKPIEQVLGRKFDSQPSSDWVRRFSPRKKYGPKRFHGGGEPSRKYRRFPIESGDLKTAIGQTFNR